MQLVIAEKPSVAQSLSRILGVTTRKDGYLEGNGFLVSWCFGHLAGLADASVYDERYAKWKREDLPILPCPFRFEIFPDKRDQFSVLKELMNREDVTEVINACDAGREGELIFRSGYYLADCQKPMKRLWISSMEDEAIRDGLQNLRPGSDFDGLYKSALCRAKADWLVGINATRYFSAVRHEAECGQGHVSHAVPAGAAGIGNLRFRSRRFLHRESGFPGFHRFQQEIPGQNGSPAAGEEMPESECCGFRHSPQR